MKQSKPIPFGSSATALYWAPLDESALGQVAQTSRNRGFAVRDAAPDRASALKTLRFCLQAGHMSVFEFAQIVFRVECPIFVARQLMRYRAASYMERSLRYCAPQSRGYWELHDASEACAFTEIDAHEKYSLRRYDALVDDGERKELARAVLPLSTPTVFLMRVDLRALFHIFAERLTARCQIETRAVVEQMRDEAALAFPFTIENWLDLYYKETLEQ